ncbi:MAG TPA: VWA domain-containing protein [Polyangiaceae bacterium]|nr:VWA domain-containing protein [Polyangiaceae bacterium]
MKLKRVALLSLGGMVLSSLAVYAVTDPTALAAPATNGVGQTVRQLVDVSGSAADAARFEQEGTLRVEGRLGHATVTRASNRTFVALEVRGGDATPTTRPDVHMALVIDRSGSMKNGRLEQAKRAARGVVDRLADGDTVSVISFDTKARVEAARTVVDGSSRQRVNDAIDRIALGGDTCVSCGIDEAIAQMNGLTAGAGMQRVIVLSDGDTNHGVRDLDGFRRIAQRCRSRGLVISTVGLGVDYNERLLSTVAFESNGLHHFVEDETSLARVFEQETRSAVQALASDARVELELAPGVRLLRVFDRSFERRGQHVTVPLGTFASGETKTVLVEVEVSGGANEALSVAHVALHYDDHALGRPGLVQASLAARFGPRAAELDPFVAARLERARTSAALERANEQAKRGDVLAARETVRRRAEALRAAAARNKAPGDARSRDIDESFRRQIEFADEAVDAFDVAAQPAAPPKSEPRAVRINQERAHTMDL